MSNYVLVVGRVSNPGIIHFDGTPYLLDALAKAGTLPVGGASRQGGAEPVRDFRGRHEIVWINLKSLLKGRDLSLNIPLRRGDIIYIPDADDQLIYVMGEVNKPGAYRLTPDMSFMDALAQAGGPTDNGAKNRVLLARPSIGIQKTIDFNEYLKARGEHNYMLEEGDIVYMPQSTMAKIGYFLQQFNPITQTLLFGAAIFKRETNNRSPKDTPPPCAKHSRATSESTLRRALAIWCRLHPAFRGRRYRHGGLRIVGHSIYPGVVCRNVDVGSLERLRQVYRPVHGAGRGGQGQCLAFNRD